MAWQVSPCRTLYHLLHSQREPGCVDAGARAEHPVGGCVFAGGGVDMGALVGFLDADVGAATQ